MLILESDVRRLLDQPWHCLAWAVLECKYVYYEGVNHGLQPIPDEIYDRLEQAYLEKVLDDPDAKPSAFTMVGLDTSRPSVRLASRCVHTGSSTITKFLNVWRQAISPCAMCESVVATVRVGKWAVVCYGCGFETPGESPDDAIENWNLLAGW
jgi:hypothetical protein